MKYHFHTEFDTFGFGLSVSADGMLVIHFMFWTFVAHVGECHE